MNFTMSERQKHWRDHVMAFMDAHVIRAVETYDRQDEAGDRWEGYSGPRRAESQGESEGLGKLFLPPSTEHDEGEFHGAGLSNFSTTRRARSKWAACPGRRKSSIARRPIPATWRFCIATARMSRKPSG